MTHAERGSRMPTLFAPGISGREVGEVLVLGGEEVRHVRALRLAPGAGIRLTDGAGALWGARIRTLDGRSAECVLEERLPAPARLSVDLAFGIGNKAHVMWLVEKATELGVASLAPLEAERTRSVADAGRSPAFWEKAGRRSLSAVKQSGGAWLPDIFRPRSVGEYLDDLAARNGEAGSGSFRVRLEGGAEPLRSVLVGWGGPTRLCLVVGPEGGWTDSEADRFEEAGFRSASLGPLVLRFETAAIAGLAIVAQHVLGSAAQRHGSTNDTGD